MITSPDPSSTHDELQLNLGEQIRQRSESWVHDIRASGPVPSKDVERVIKNAHPELFIPAIGRKTQLRLNIATVIWWICILGFLAWWFRPEHIGTIPGLVLNSIVIVFMLLLPAAFITRLRSLRRVNPEIPLPDVRVAMVTTRAPSEPWDEVRPTLEAFLSQKTDLHYDSWLCDEAPTNEVAEWCEKNGINLLSRQNRPDYHRTQWPRRTRSKEGNLAYFYDAHGYEHYDIVAQFDCDHVPATDYLNAIVRPFSDPDVGFVAAPSMCDMNRSESWSGRGRLFAEASVHGPHQLSHNGGLTPTAIGSHYAVRTATLARAGGLGPELAEDFSTSYVIRLTGSDGVFAIDAEAHGQGPPTFAAMVTQEFQWSRSLIVLLLSLVCRTLPTFGPRLQFRFIFALMIMPIMGLMSGAGILLAPAAVIFNQQWMSLNFLVFILLTWVLSIPLVYIMIVLRGEGLLRPNNFRIINWESGLFQLVRWPYIVRGLIAGVRQVVFRTEASFRVTPKGSRELTPISLNVVAPYHFLALSMVAVGLWGTLADRIIGYAGLTLLLALIYGFSCWFIPWMHLRELPSGIGTRSDRRRAVLGPLFLGSFTFFVTILALSMFITIFFGGYQWIL